MLITNDPGRQWVFPMSGTMGFPGDVGTQLLPEWGSIPISYSIRPTGNLTGNVNFFSTNPNAWLGGQQFLRGLSGSFQQPECGQGAYMRGGNVEPLTGLPPTTPPTQITFTAPTDTNLIMTTPGSGAYTLLLCFFRAAPLYLQAFVSDPFDVVGQCAQPQNLAGTQVGQTFLLSWNGPSLVNIDCSTDGGASWFNVVTDYVGNDYLLNPGFFGGAIPPQFRVAGVCEYGVQSVTSIDVTITLTLAPAGGNRPRHRATRR